MLFWQLVARFPAGMMTIGLLTWGEQRFQSYAYGGLLVAVFTLGFAAGSSLSARLFRVLGSAKVLRVDAVVSASAMVLLVLVPWDFPVAVVSTAVIGLAFPPVTPLARSLYARLSSGTRLLRVYSLDAIAQETIWILSPMCAVGIAGLLGPATVILACAFFALLGTWTFAGLEVLRVHEPRHLAAGRPRADPVPPAVVGFFLIGFFLVASGAFIEVYVVERFGYESLVSGFLLALTAAGSIAGGVVFAARAVTRYSLALRMLIVVAGLLVAAAAPTLWLLPVGLFLSGAGIAPAFTAMHARIAVVAPPARAAETYAFANTMQLIGLAAGSAAAGMLVTAVSSEAALLTAAGCVMVAVTIAALVGHMEVGRAPAGIVGRSDSAVPRLRSLAWTGQRRGQGMTEHRAWTGGGAAVVEALRANGVRTVFGIPGTHNLEMYRYLPGSGIDHVLCRHEQGAMYAADGYARSGAGIAAVVVTSGPGLLNAASGIANAYADRVPIVVLAPVIDRGRERRDIGWMHEVKDQRAALDAIAAWSETAADAEDAAMLVHRAFLEWAAGETRPVVINVPHDVLVDPAPIVPMAPLPVPSRAVPSPETVTEAHRILSDAQTPIVLVGGGCVRAYRELRPFLEMLGAPVVSTARGKGVLPDGHPLALGAVIGTAVARSALEDADAVLLIGTELSEAELLDEPLRLTGSVIRVDRELKQLHKGVRADLPVLSDAGRFANAMAGLAWTPEDPVRTATLRSAVEAEIDGIASSFRTVHRALVDALPADAIIAGDSSQVSYMGTTLLWSSPQPDRVLGTLGFATLGYGLPAAIGAALGNPGTAVACVLGDGAFMFSVQELATAVDRRLSLPVIVFDNDGFGEIRDQMSARDIEHVGVDIDQPDLAALGRALGCAASEPRTERELADAVREALRTDRPTLIHVRANDFD